MPTLCWTALASECYLVGRDGNTLDLYYHHLWHIHEVCHEAWHDLWPTPFASGVVSWLWNSDQLDVTASTLGHACLPAPMAGTVDRCMLQQNVIVLVGEYALLQDKGPGFLRCTACQALRIVGESGAIGPCRTTYMAWHV